MAGKNTQANAGVKARLSLYSSLYTDEQLKDKALHVLRVNGYDIDATMLATKLDQSKDRAATIEAIRASGVYVY